MCRVGEGILSVFVLDTGLLGLATRGVAGSPTSVFKLNRLSAKRKKVCSNVKKINVTLQKRGTCGDTGPTSLAKLVPRCFFFSLKIDKTCRGCSRSNTGGRSFGNGLGGLNTKFHVTPQ